MARVLVRAFDDDPLLRWAFDRPSRRDAASLRFFDWWIGELIGQDVTWTTPEIGGAAVWAMPGSWHSSMGSQLRLAASVFTSVRHPISTIRGMTSIESAHPKEPHLYLALLGVDPARQGEGLGSALIAPGLAVADEERWPAYLETAKDRNLDFYGRQGFEVVGTVDLPRGGPRMWRMWREPR
jgi:GNAT superfamily N-acetyltransferase